MAALYTHLRGFAIHGSSSSLYKYIRSSYHKLPATQTSQIAREKYLNNMEKSSGTEQIFVWEQRKSIDWKQK